MAVWIATGNKGKAKEFNLLFSAFEKCYFLSDLPNYKAPEETGSSFEENARIKALALSRYLDKLAKESDRREKISQIESSLRMGEDSGLEVLALDSAPGIYSARYAGPLATDQENVDLLLHNMKNVSDREACFVSYIVALSVTGQEYSVEGRLKGSISFEPRGREGFGYDPVFIPKGYSKTMAELGMEYKNRYSHRAEAVQKLLKFISRL